MGRPGSTVEGSEGLTRLRQALEASSVAFLVLEAVRDADGACVDFQVEEANRAALALLGRARGDVIGQRLTAVAPDLLGPECVARMCDVARSGERMEDEVELPSASGPGTWVHCMVAPAGDGVAVTLVDVTARRGAEEALRVREEELSALSDATLEALFVHQDGVILATNKAARELYRLPPDGGLGHRLFEYVAPEAREDVLRHIQARSSEPYESMGLRADGTTFPAAVQARTATFHGRPARLSAIRDLTELRRMQASLAFADRMASVGTLAAGVAHEINNPLAFVLLGLEQTIRKLAQPISLDEQRPLANLLTDVLTGAERIRDIVRDLRAFSRADDESVGPVDLRSVVEYAARMAGVEVRHRARLDVDVPELPAVRGNVTRLGQVFLNLLVNAAQAIEPGAADRNVIRVSAVARSHEEVVTVSDTGLGIPPDMLGRIFEPFVTTKTAGTGLGLAICHGIVTRLGGSITVQSVPGQGTSFSVALPLAPPSHPSDAPPASAAPSRPPRRRPHVLVVDDEPLLARTATQILQPDYQVMTAGSAAEALERFEHGERFDVVLCDLMMPRVTGMDLFVQMREKWPELASRTLFLTGGVFSTGAREFLATCGQPWLEKPFTIDAIHAAVRRIVGDR